MANKQESFVCDCNFSGIKPALMDLPYPPVRVRERNQSYADLISVSYCGTVSEMSATMQYINNESRIIGSRCIMGKILLGMALAEMTHMQILAELIGLLGGNVSYIARQPGRQPWMWSPQCLTLPEKFDAMLQADLEREIATIDQYNMQISMMKDDYVNTVLGRIIQDEQYHIMLLRSLMDGQQG